jgi:hypothetical protein
VLKGDSPCGCGCDLLSADAAGGAGAVQESACHRPGSVRLLSS